MTVTSVTTTSFIKQTVLFVRDKISAKVTDPISSTRSGSEKFVMSEYPQLNVTYPIITVRKENVVTSGRLGFSSELHLVSIPLEVRVWAKNVVQKDALTQEVINALRSTERDNDGSINGNLYSFEILSTVDVNEPAPSGIKSTVISVNYDFVLGE